MFYILRKKIEIAHVEATPYEEDIHLTEGVIHQVDVMFQSGCNHEINVQIWQANQQIWPSNRGKSLTGDATIVSFREFYPVAPGNQILTVKAWGPDPALDKYIEVHLGVLARRIIQPLSFEELLAAAAGIE